MEEEADFQSYRRKIFYDPILYIGINTDYVCSGGDEGSCHVQT
jgi:hypothetical protein